LANQAPFDRIHIAFAIESIPENLKRQLKVNGGMLICPTSDYNLKIVERNGIDEFVEEIVPGLVMEAGKSGLA